MKIQDTLYAKYIHEREGLSILEDESSFITYKFVEKECFIANMYIDPTQRGSLKLRNLIDQLSEIAKQNGCEVISANMYVEAKTIKMALIAALKIGFEIIAANNGALLIVKELKGDI